MENEKEEKGVTLGRIFKVSFGNWKLFTPIALVIAIGCFLGIHLGLNPTRSNYVSTFSYSSADLSYGKYADGTDFFYKNLISPSNLNTVKESSESYASIDVDKMLNNNGIKIKSNEDDNTYTITVAYKSISNFGVAKSFVNDIVESALKKDAAIVNEGKYDNSLSLFDESDTFEDQVRFLRNQANYLVDQYSILSNVTKTGDGTIVKNSSSLPTAVIEKANANSEQISVLIPSNFVETMNYRISSNGYVKDYNSRQAKSFDTDYAALEQEQLLNKDKIDALGAEINNLGTSAAIASLSSEMEKLILRNEEIKFELQGINNKKANKDVDPSSIPGYTDFVKDLTFYRSQLSNAVDAYKDVLKNAYIDNASVTYDNSSIIVSTGSVGIVLNLALSVVAGVIVGAIVNLITDRKKLYE